jgi:hypothetical protein
LVKARSPKKYTHAEEALNGFRPIHKHKGFKRDNKPAYSDNLEPGTQEGTVVKSADRPQYEPGYSRPTADYGAGNVATSTAQYAVPAGDYGNTGGDDNLYGSYNVVSGSGCGNPGAGYGTPGAPGHTNGDPWSAYGAPGSEYGATGSEYGTPRSAYRAPDSAYGAPESAYSAPGSAYGAPGSDCPGPTSVVVVPAERFNIIALLLRQGKHKFPLFSVK